MKSSTDMDEATSTKSGTSFEDAGINTEKHKYESKQEIKKYLGYGKPESISEFFQINYELEENMMNIILSCKTMLISWMFGVGCVVIRSICDSCGSQMKLRKDTAGIKIWQCSSGDPGCTEYPFSEKFSFNKNISMKSLIKTMFMWYRFEDIKDIIEENSITDEEYEKFDNILTEVCIMKCMRGSKKIGGAKVRVNIEIGKRGGIADGNNIVICGVSPKDHKQYFFDILPNENPTHLEINECLRNWLIAGTIVYTSSDEYKFTEYKKWNKTEIWPLINCSDCLARDLWIHVNQHLRFMFRYFIKDVIEFFNE